MIGVKKGMGNNQRIVMKGLRRLAFAALVVFGLTPLASTQAMAACTGPAGAEGRVIYNTDFHVLQFCNGTTWIGTGGSAGGATPSGAAGSVQISGGSSLASDASNFFWDTTNHRLGVGTTTPAQALDVVGKATASSMIYKSVTSTAAPATGSSMWSTDGTNVWRTTGYIGLGTATPATGIQINGDGGANDDINIQAYSATASNSGLLRFRRTRGTTGVPTAPNSGDALGIISFSGWNGTTWTGTSSIASYTSAAFGTSADSALSFNTAKAGSSAEAMRIDADGNVGIGTSTPGAKLDVNGIAAAGTLQAGKPSDYWGTFGSYYSVSGYGQLDSKGSYETTLTSNGYRDNSTPTNLWKSLGANGSTGAAQISLSPLGRIYFAVDSSKATGSSATVTTRMTIDDSGYVGIGLVAPNAALHVNGTALFGGTALDGTAATVANGVVISPTGYLYIKRNGTASQTHIAFLNNAAVTPTQVGAITTSGSATTYATSSDRRLKENIKETTRGLDTLMKIDVDDFNFITDAKKSRVQGFIAQQLYTVYPEAVVKGDDGAVVKDQWSVDYGRVTPLIIKAVQEQQVEITALKAQNADLLKRLEALEAKE